jgi:hypothetical protein
MQLHASRVAYERHAFDDVEVALHESGSSL